MVEWAHRGEVPVCGFLSSGEKELDWRMREMHVGYNHAAKIIDLLDVRGVIGPARGAGPREVLAME